jgi:hypothetical protein
MDLPFSVNEFFGVFELYNLGVWPAQWLFYALGVVAVTFAVKNGNSSDKITSLILSFFWLWMGAVYHLIFFTKINPAAWLFGLMFILQAGLLYGAGLWKAKLSFKPRLDVYGIAGAILILYGMVIYPAIGFLLGHRYPAAPTFGLPCPTTIFTFGLFCWADHPAPGHLLVIPLIWTVIGSFAAFRLGVKEDLGLLAAGITGIALILGRAGNRS